MKTKTEKNNVFQNDFSTVRRRVPPLCGLNICMRSKHSFNHETKEGVFVSFPEVLTAEAEEFNVFEKECAARFFYNAKKRGLGTFKLTFSLSEPKRRKDCLQMEMEIEKQIKKGRVKVYKKHFFIDLNTFRFRRGRGLTKK